MDSTVNRRRALGLGGLALAGGSAAWAAGMPSAAHASPGAATPAINVKNPPSPIPAAVGNGTADDTLSIQGSINAAAAGGGTVFFPVGRYKVTTTILVPSGVHLEGESGLKNTVTWAGTSEVFASGDFTVIRSDPQGVTGISPGTRDIRLKDLSIRGVAGTATSTSRGAVSLRNTVGSVIDGCRIYGGGIAALELTGGDNVVRHCQIGGILEVLCGIYCDDASGDTNGMLTDSMIVDNMNITTGRGAFAGFGGHGIRLGASSGHNIIGNNFIFFCDYGIYDAGSIGDVISGNRIDMNMRSGVYITAVGEHAITGNSFHTNGGVTGVTANERAGVRISGSGGSSAITGNVFRNWSAYTGPGEEDDKLQQYGVVLLGSTHHNAITGNTFANQGVGGILDTSSQSATNIKSGNAGQA